MRPIHALSTCSTAFLALAACQRPDAAPSPPAGRAMAGPIHLEPRTPEEYPGLHHVLRLGERIISGAEPQGEEAFARLAAMGVRTILSVDGKAPDAGAAARHGLRYVHIPIHYSGPSAEELLRIAKTFRELRGPFYVHCYHGTQRGPTAAALGRIVLDGVARERAAAEIRTWCGTSEKYGGLLAAIEQGPIPAARATQAYAWDFPAAQPPGSFRQAMVAIARHQDNLKLLAARGWEPDPEHPDLDARNEAAQIADLIERSAALPAARAQPADFHRRAAEAARAGRELAGRLGGDRSKLEESFAGLRRRCSACHTAYRDR